MRRSIRRLIPLLLVLLAAPAGLARACINGTLQATDGWTWEVQKAEKSLALGDHATAALRVIELFPAVMGDTVPTERAGLFERSRRVLALAIARAGGRFIRAEIARDAALVWAVKVLQARHQADLDDPLRAADLAEALALVPTGREQAYALLAELARADLMPDPRGWAVLGALARSLGRLEIGRIAANHCHQTASQGWLCNVPLA